MSLNIRYPNITGTTEREQLMQMKNYLWQLVENLNYEFRDVGKQETKETKQTVGSSLGKQPTVSEFLKAAMPVGHIYISLSETNPNVLFGFGTWERIEDRFLLAAGKTYSAGSTGGAATHTLTVNELPSHTFKLTMASSSNTGTINTNQIAVGREGTTYSNSNAINSVGGGKAHNNMPPYTTVYVWKRTA